MRIMHCGSKRKTIRYWLYPDREQPGPEFDYQVLHEADCPKCKGHIMEVCGFTFEKGMFPAHRVRGRLIEYWEKRKETELYKADLTGHKPGKDTTVILFVGEYTQMISRGIQVDGL